MRPIDYPTTASPSWASLQKAIAKIALGAWGAFLVAEFDRSLAWSQIRYPATQYRAFDPQSPSQDAFAVGPPRQTDSAHSQSNTDYRAMSPDSWEQPTARNFLSNDPFSQTSDKDFLPDNRGGLVRREQNPENSRPSAANRRIPEPTPAVPADIRLKSPLPPGAFLAKWPAGGPLSPPSAPATLESNRNSQQAKSIIENQDPAAHDDFGLELSRMAEIPNPVTDSPQRMNSPLPLGALAPALPGADPVRQNRSELPAPSQAAPQTPGDPHQGTEVHPFFWNRPSLMNLYGSPVELPHYRPDLGHRSQDLTNRENRSNDYGQSFDFETKKTEYPSVGEIFTTGRFFASSSIAYWRPSFQGNTAIFQNLSGVTETFDFSYKLSPQFQLGFESKFGPGIEIDFWSYHDFSRAATFTSNGIESGTASAWLRGANQWSRLTAENSGETLTARHRMEVDVVGVSFFKEVKLPRARINGKYGFQTAHIIHELVADLQDGGAVSIGRLRSRSDVRALGPQIDLQYFRPIGHTKLEFVASAGGSVLFGKQSQEIENTAGLNQSRMKADEFILTFEYFAGAQYRLMRGENRYWFVRGGMNYQAWLHGGTAVLPQDDFGLRGLVLSAGINR